MRDDIVTAAAPAEHMFRPPMPSRASRTISARSKRSSRARIVGGPVPTEMRLESGLEKKVVLVLLARPDVVDVEEQPEPVCYLDEAGARRSHTFDALARLRCGTRVLVEVKPAQSAERKGLREQLATIAAQVPRSVADKVVLITDEQLSRDLVHDATLIHCVRRDPDQSHDVVVRTFVDGLNGVVTIASIVAATGGGSPSFRAVVRLIADGTLSIVGPRRITHRTRVASAACHTDRSAA